jgi:FkbH-like protein
MKREETRQSLSRAEFLKELSLVVHPIHVLNANDPRFARCIELLNKTNQFNTTGRRWSAAEIDHLLRAGGWFLAFDIKDKYTAYGLTALMLIVGDVIEQFVMSCRVFGMEIEKACVAIACNALFKSGTKSVQGKIQSSGKNQLSISAFETEGFHSLGEGVWTLELQGGLQTPKHITVETG